MKIKVRYQSRGGNTRAVAEVIAEAFGVPAMSVEHPLDEPADVLFLGGGVYEWKMDQSLSEFIEQLSADKARQIVTFSTTGLMDSTIKQITQAAKQKGIKVNENYLLLKMGLHGHSMLRLKGGNLTEAQFLKIQQFVQQIKEEL